MLDVMLARPLCLVWYSVGLKISDYQVSSYIATNYRTVYIPNSALSVVNNGGFPPNNSGLDFLRYNYNNNYYQD